MSTVYRVQEFSELAGVTIRTLHHYDRLALLRPRRTGAGYRLYGLRDLERLEQVVALKFLGLPLKRIKTLLDQQPRALPDALRAQLRALEEKRRHLDRAIGAIRDAERAIQPGKPADAAVLKRIIEVIEMQTNPDFMKKYYSDEAAEKLADRRANWTPEQQKMAEEGTRLWTVLFKDIEAALERGVDPASDAAQALVSRWRALVESFTGGDKQIEAGVKKAWADQANWPQALQQQSTPFGNPKVWEFIGKAAAAKKK